MNWLDNFSIKTRLWGSFALVLGLLACVTTIGVRGGWNAEKEINAIINQEMLKLEVTASINAANRANARNTLQLFVVSPEERPAIRARMVKLKSEIDGHMDKLDKLLYTPKGHALFEDIKTKRAAYVSAYTEAADTLEQRGAEAGLVVLNKKVLPAIDALSQPIEDMLHMQQELASKRGQESEEAMRLETEWNLGLGIAAMVIGLAAAGSLVVSIMDPLKTALVSIDAMAKGDLTHPISVSGHNEISAMMESLDHMRENLSHVIARIQESTAQVAAASSQIAMANIDLSSRTEEQASALEQTAATMEELTSTVNQNAQTTTSARRMAEHASEAARGVGERVARVVTTMQDIHQSSERIRDIVSVIDSIAFQTNILALNAAVEAARAGDQGRGFAVVASEVRALAQRSASAAQEIKGIIEDNVAKMDAGNQQASLAGTAVQDAVQSIENVNVTVAEIDHASKEQSAGIGQVGEAVGQIDSVTQQNAALVEETAAATKNLDEQVQGLKTQLSRFRIHPGAGNMPLMLKG